VRSRATNIDAEPAVSCAANIDAKRAVSCAANIDAAIRVAAERAVHRAAARDTVSIPSRHGESRA
jgi:hypothetical protein